MRGLLSAALVLGALAMAAPVAEAHGPTRQKVTVTTEVKAAPAEVWEAMNGCYMAVRDALARKVSERDLPKVLGLVRQRTALVRGATHGTMLRNDIYDFARIGTFLERADNTARILDTKYYVLLPSAYAGAVIDELYMAWIYVLFACVFVAALQPLGDRRRTANVLARGRRSGLR